MSSRGDHGQLRGQQQNKRRRGAKKGPRKAANPSAEFNAILQESKDAYFRNDLDRALKLVEQAISVNPEIFPAHLLKSTIHRAQGDLEQAALALYLGAHSFPRDPAIWQRAIDAFYELAEESEGEERQKYLRRLNICYKRLLMINPKNYELRLKRAIVLKDSGHIAQALTQLNGILQELPHNVGVLEQMALIYLDLKQYSRIIQLYEECISHNQALPQNSRSFAFEDILIFVDLIAKTGQITQAIQRLKSLTRWLLGRESEEYWDKVQDDDREWDAEDLPRRQQVDEFRHSRFPLETYGYGLPLELRVKLGSLRFKLEGASSHEALAHFEWLEPEDRQKDAKVYQFGGLFRNVAELLKNARRYKEALRFFQPLLDSQSFSDAEFWYSTGLCSLRCDNQTQAIDCFEACKAADAKHIEARVELGGIYSEAGETEKARLNATEAIYLGRQAILKPHRRRYERAEDRWRREEAENKLKEAHQLQIGRILTVPNRRRRPSTLAMRPVAPIWRKGDGAKAQQQARTLYSSNILGPDDPVQSIELAELGYELGDEPQSEGRRKTPRDPDDIERERVKQQERVQNLYKMLLSFQPAMRVGDLDARNAWLDAAETLTRWFRTNRNFYPPDSREMNYERFQEVDRENVLKSKYLHDESLVEDNGNEPPKSSTQSTLPTDHCGISLSKWLDIFLEFALVLASMGEAQKTLCYKMLDAATGCIIWYRSKEAMLQIHICYLSCSLRLNDSETMTRVVARWFMREFQFVTDTYRLFNALNLLYRFPNASRNIQMKSANFRTGPSQKFLLRQIQSLDRSLPEDYGANSPHGPVPKFMRTVTGGKVADDTSKRQGDDEAISTQSPQEMDVCLLVLYGHILYAAGSFTNALNYFFRAYGLDSKNPMILFSIALAYCHQNTKRQSEDRHGFIIQGLSFFEKYKEARLESVNDQTLAVKRLIKTEIQFNEARLWDLMGLSNLATQGYKRVLDSSGDMEHTGSSNIAIANGDASENFSREAAYALQTIYALSGDVHTARQITEKWLVIE